MTKQPRVEQPVDRLDRRWRIHADDGTGKEGPTQHHRHVLSSDHYGMKNETATPLDAYVHAGFLTNAQFNAGDQVRELWAKAGREPKMVRDLEIVGHSSEEMTDAQSEAWHDLVRIIKPLIPLHQSVVERVCFYGEGAEGAVRRWAQPDWLGLLILRDALDALTRK